MESTILLELALILGCTKAFGLLSKKIHLPQVVGALLAGIILGPALLGFVRQSDMITVLAEIGVILLMFSAGLETDIKQLKTSLKSSLIIAFLGAIVPLGGGLALSYLFGFDLLHCLFIGLILTATSISITVETLQEMGKIKSKTGATIMGAAVIDDILGVIILSLVIGMNGGDSSPLATGIMLFKIIVFFGLAWFCGYFMLKLIESLSSKYGKTRRVPILSLAFCFYLAFLADYFGIADITGAYIAGLALCSSEAESYIEKRSTELSYMFFSPVFFVSVGLHASFNGLTPDILLFSGLLLIVALLTKFVGCGLGAKLCGFAVRECAQIGAGMVSRGEVAIIIATKGIAMGMISSQLFSSVIVIIIITTLSAPLFLKLAFSHKKSRAEIPSDG